MTSPTFSRRSLLGLGAATSAALAAGGLLSGCSGSSGPLRVAWYGPDPVTKAINSALTSFQSSAGVEYAAENAPFADYWDKLATQTSGNNAPDVMRMSLSYFSDYASRGTLKDLSGLTIDTSTLDPDVAASGILDGRNYGVGQSSISHALYLDDAAVERSGVSAPADGSWTWDEFATFAKAYAAAVPGSFGSSDQAGNFQIFETWARQHGTELFAPDGSALAVSQQTIADWWSYWAALRSAKAVPEQKVSGETSTIEKSLLVAGKAPLQFGWVQQVSFYQPLVKSQLSVRPVPQGSAGDLSGQFIKGLDLWSISAGSKHAEDAAKLVDFLINDDAAVKAIGILLGVPPSKQARDLVKADADSAGARAIGYIEEIADKVGPAPAAWPKGYGELLTTFSRIAENIGFGKSDPTAGAQEFVDTAAKTLGK